MPDLRSRAIARLAGYIDPTPVAMSRDGNSKHPRTVFGRRKGHKLTVRHAGLMQTLLPQLALDLSIRPTDLSSLFPYPVEDVWLEIGFGGGEHMIDQSRAHPRVGILGVEPFVNGMAKALAAIDAHALSNIRLHHGDAMELLDWLPRPVAETPPLEASFHARPKDCGNRIRAALGWRVSFRDRHCRLRRLDAQAHAAVPGF